MLISKKLIRFLSLAFILYAGWLIFYELILRSSGRLDHFITENITWTICFLLDISGYQTHYTIADKPGETFIFLIPSTNPLIRVGASCNGLELLVLFAIFIICYPGKIKEKLWFIPLGLACIHILNIIRNYLLTLMEIHNSSWFEFFHRYVFIFIVYGAIFILWLWWANRQKIGNENK